MELPGGLRGEDRALAAAEAAVVDSGDAVVLVGEFLTDLGLGNGVHVVQELGFLGVPFRWVVLSFSVGGDLPDKVSARVYDEGVSAVVDSDVIGGIDLFEGEGGEEEVVARAEVVGGEGVERRDPRRKCCGGDGVGGVLV